MKISDVLALKGSAVHSLPPEAPLTEALERMNRHRIGCFMVTDKEHENKMLQDYITGRYPV